MSKSETGHFRPEESGAAKAFDVVNILHSKVGNTVDSIRKLSLEGKRKIASDYMSVVVGYFANHRDDYLRRVGTTILDAIKSERVGVETNKSRELKNKELQFIIEFSNEKATLLIPLEFIVLARKKPIVALASMLGAFSQIVDFLNKDAPLDPSLVEERAGATQAHFLKRVRTNPEITSDPDCIRVLSKYPNGIYDLVKSVI